MEDKNLIVTGREDWLNYLAKEYDIALQRKQNLENRAGIMIAFLGTVCVLSIKELSSVFYMISINIPNLKFIQILSALIAYIVLIVSIIASFKVIDIQLLDVVKINEITEKQFTSSQDSCRKVIMSIHVKSIDSLNKANEKKCNFLRLSIFTSLIYIFLILIVFIIN